METQRHMNEFYDFEDRHLEIDDKDQVEYYTRNVLGKTKDRFDLEQEITDCWQITKDISTLYEGVVESNLTSDQIANTLLGLNQLYELKFNKLFTTFEKLIAEKTIR